MAELQRDLPAIVIYSAFVGYSLYNSFQDIRSQHIYGNLALVLASCSLVAGLLFWNNLAIGRLIVCGGLIVILILRSRISLGIGAGDLKYMIYMASILDLMDFSGALAAGSLLALLWSVPHLIRGEIKKTTRIPFVPFLSAGALLLLIIRIVV